MSLTDVIAVCVSFIRIAVNVARVQLPRLPEDKKSLLSFCIIVENLCVRFSSTFLLSLSA